MSDYSNLLKESNLKITHGRLAVMEVLGKSSEPLDVSAIFQQINNDFNQYDRASVYRSIETLVNQGLVKQIDFREGKYRYELHGDHHHHLVCKKCGSITPVYDECLALTNTVISQKYQFLVKEHYLEFFGLCSKCQ